MRVDFRTIVFALLALVLAGSPALAQGKQGPEEDCISGAGNVMIAGCSAIIESGMLFGQPITDGDLAVPYNNRGNMFRDQQNMAASLTDLSEAIRLDPQYSTAYYNRGLTYQLSSEFDLAIADYSIALRLAPGEIDYLNNRGNTYRLLGRYEEALADLNFNLERDPRFLPSLYNRGLVYEASGRVDLARADYRSVMKLDPNFEDAAIRFAALQ